MRAETIPGADNNYDPGTNPEIKDVTKPETWDNVLDITDLGSNPDIEEVTDYPRTTPILKINAQAQQTQAAVANAWIKGLEFTTPEDQAKYINENFPGVLDGTKTPSGQEIPQEDLTEKQWEIVDKHLIDSIDKLSLDEDEKTPRQIQNEQIKGIQDKYPLPVHKYIDEAGIERLVYDRGECDEWGRLHGLKFIGLNKDGFPKYTPPFHKPGPNGPIYEPKGIWDSTHDENNKPLPEIIIPPEMENNKP